MAKKLGLFIPIIFFVTSCASVETRLPVPEISLLNAEAGVQEKQAFSRYIDMLERLDRVSAKVLHANAELCQKTGPDIGVLTHTKKTYPKHLREAVARRANPLHEAAELRLHANP